MTELPSLDLATFREQARDRYADVQWPKRTDEAWRFSNLGLGTIDSFGREETLTTSIEGAIDGVEVLSLEEGISRFGEALWNRLTELRGRLGSAPFSSLGQSLDVLQGQVIYLPPGLRLEAPVVISRKGPAETGSSSFVTVVMAGQESSGTVLEKVSPGGDAPVLVFGNSLVLAGERSQISYALTQDLGRESKIVHEAIGAPETGATARLLAANLGSGWVRQEMEVRLAHPEAHCELLGLNVLVGGQEVDQRTEQVHASPSSSSNLLFKNVLMDQARVIFGGLIKVDHGAHHTDAFQTCRSLLLSDEAEANAMPGLEILADQVKCSHGATSGQIDPGEVFYLRSRGISETQARRLVAGGFTHEIAERFGSPELAAELEDAVGQRLEGRIK